MVGWQHQLDPMQIICITLQTDNHASTSPLKFITGLMPFLPLNQQCQSTESKDGPNELLLPFNGHLSRTTWVSRYQKKYSPTHTYPDHQSSFIWTIWNKNPVAYIVTKQAAKVKKQFTSWVAATRHVEVASKTCRSLHFNIPTVTWCRRVTFWQQAYRPHLQ